MSKVVTVIDLGGDSYEVATMKNTVRFKIGQILGKEDVEALIIAGFEVPVKGPKEPKGE